MPGAPRSKLWGWGRPARRLLAVFALAPSILLYFKAPATELPPPVAPVLIVDVNTVPGPVLEALPRLGPAIVRRIVAEREKRPFQSLEEFDARVRGVGPSTVAALIPHVRFDTGENPTSLMRGPTSPR